MNVLHHDLVYPLLADYRREYEDKLLAARRRSPRAATLLRRLTSRG